MEFFTVIVTPKKFLITIIILSILIKIPIMVFYVDYPDIPHDNYSYLEAAHIILNGLTLYKDETYGHFTMYGSLFALTMAGWVKMFGDGYIGLKIPSLIFDILTIIPIYLIIRHIKDKQTARYGAVVYTFSYIVLANIMEGSNNHMFVLFMMLSVYFLLKNSHLSPIMLALSVGFKSPALIIIPPILYYVYKNYGIKQSILYISIFGGVFGLILLPFYLKAGMNVFYPYFPNSMDLQIPLGTNIVSILGFLDYFFNYGIEFPYEQYVFPSEVIKPLTYGSLLLGIVYTVTRTPTQINLIKSCFVMFFSGLMFSMMFNPFYILWFFPFIVILFVDRIPSVKGMGLTFLSVLMTSYFFRWDIEYSYFEKILLLTSVLFAFWGAKLMFPTKPSISYMTLGASAHIQMHVYFLMLLSPIISMFAIRKFAWGIFWFGNSIFMVIVMFWILKNVVEHNEDRRIS